MAHQCVRCGLFYQDGATEVMAGCTCGAKLFFYIKKNKLADAKEMVQELTNEEKEQIEQDVVALIGDDNEKPVILDLETIRVVQPGKYELDLVHLFKNEPLVYKVEEGKYIIDIVKSLSVKKK